MVTVPEFITRPANFLMGAVAISRENFHRTKK